MLILDQVLCLLFAEIVRTQILDVLIPEKRQRAALAFPTLSARTVALEDHDSVGCSGRDEGGAVAVACPAAGSVEGDVAQAVAESAEEERHMSTEPCELQTTQRVSIYSNTNCKHISHVWASFSNLACRGSDGEAWVGAMLKALVCFACVASESLCACRNNVRIG